MKSSQITPETDMDGALDGKQHKAVKPKKEDGHWQQQLGLD